MICVRIHIDILLRSIVRSFIAYVTVIFKIGPVVVKLQGSCTIVLQYVCQSIKTTVYATSNQHNALLYSSNYSCSFTVNMQN